MFIYNLITTIFKMLSSFAAYCNNLSSIAGIGYCFINLSDNISVETSAKTAAAGYYDITAVTDTACAYQIFFGDFILCIKTSSIDSKILPK